MNTIYCQWCFGTGNVLALLKDSGIHIPFSFVCVCSRARRRNFPQWGKELLSTYEVLEQQAPDMNPQPRRPTPIPHLREIPR